VSAKSKGQPISSPVHAWRGFHPGTWMSRIDVQSFLDVNITPYHGDEQFLSGPTEGTAEMWNRAKSASALNSGSGSSSSSSSSSAVPQRRLQECLYDVYTEEIKTAMKAGIISGLSVMDGQDVIVGDYRRAALYGLDRVIEEKQRELQELERAMSRPMIQLREELVGQLRSLELLKQKAADNGRDLSRPAVNAREAIEWVYLAYLGVVEEAGGLSACLGRISSFLDIYLERDLAEETLTESGAQELIDQLMISLRGIGSGSEHRSAMTECLGGMSLRGQTRVTRTTFRFLHTLFNLGSSPEPNLTVLWSASLPEPFKAYCSMISIETSAIQYMNDDLLRPHYGDDYAIADGVTPLRLGKQIVSFGASVNLPKAVLYAINGGIDERLSLQAAPPLPSISSKLINGGDLAQRLDAVMEWLAGLLVHRMNAEQYVADKYGGARLAAAFLASDSVRTAAFGLAGLSVAADSLSAIQYAKVYPVRNVRGLAVDFRIEGDYPRYGYQERADDLAVELVERLWRKLRMYRSSMMDRLTDFELYVIALEEGASLGVKTGCTPDGRRISDPFALDANPSRILGRLHAGVGSVLCSSAKLTGQRAADGTSVTLFVAPKALGWEQATRTSKLVLLLDDWVRQMGHHLTINVIDQGKLQDAMVHPEYYPQLTIRLSGRATSFVKLTREQQLYVMMQTFHEQL
jgi:formate C-acetyltransferase